MGQLSLVWARVAESRMTAFHVEGFLKPFKPSADGKFGNDTRKRIKTECAGRKADIHGLLFSRILSAVSELEF